MKIDNISFVWENVRDIESLCIAKEMAEYHHGRMDGKGYPHGISGEDLMGEIQDSPQMPVNAD